MSVNPPQMVRVVCPSCQTQYTAPVQNIIDVGSDPRLKTLLLQGRLNVGVCPSCGTTGMMNLPITYHDPEKELLFCLVPQDIHVTENERQRTIGEMSNAIINLLPAEKRRGYLFQPRVFLTFQSLLEAVLEADGITKEMLQAQQEKAQLIVEMVQAVDDPLGLAALINEHKDQIDYEFFSLLTSQVQSAEQSNQTEAASTLIRLRDVLLEKTDTGKQVAEQQERIQSILEGIDENLTREDLLERILAAAGEEEERILSILISLARPLIDYQFFQMLTERASQATAEGKSKEADDLKALRDRILDLTQELDAQVRIRMQQKASLLSEIAQSSDPKATIRAHLAEIDDVFMSVLESNIVQNQQQEQQEAVDRFMAIREAIVQVLQENAPPEIRLISSLLRADYPDETRKILSNNQEMVNAGLLNTMDALVQDLSERGDAETSEKLKGIKAQATLMVR